MLQVPRFCESYPGVDFGVIPLTTSRMLMDSLDGLCWNLYPYLGLLWAIWSKQPRSLGHTTSHGSLTPGPEMVQCLK